MKRFIVVVSLCVLASSMMGIAHPASADVRVNADISNGHFYLDTQPNLILVPNTQVYYSPYGSDEVFRYHNHWYVYRNDTWFRATNYRGPFYQVDVDRVPRQVVAVPMEYRQQYRSQHNGWNDRHHRHHDWNEEGYRDHR